MRNNFKKFAAIALALVMCVSTLVPVFAATDVCPGAGSVHTKTNCTYVVVGTTEADCDTNGAVTGRCNTCLGTFAVETTPALGHKYETKDGDCTTGTRQVCAICGDTQNVEAAADHQWDKFVVDGGACEIGATVTKTCSVCGAVEQEAMKYDHNWVLTSMTEPTDCLTNGVATYKCGAEGCDATQTREVWADGTASQYHDWNPLTATSYVANPTILTEEVCRVEAAKAQQENCYTVGKYPEFCSFCGATRIREVRKTAHSFYDKANDPTGVTRYAESNVSGIKAWFASAAATGVAPTCTTKGSKPVLNCYNCEAVLTLNADFGYQVSFASGSVGYNGVMSWADVPFVNAAPYTLSDDDFKPYILITTKLADYQIAAQHKLVNSTAAGAVQTAPDCMTSGKIDVVCGDGACNVTGWKETIKFNKLGHTYLYDLSEADQEAYKDANPNWDTTVAKTTVKQSCQTAETVLYTCLNGTCGKTTDKETKAAFECVASTAYGSASYNPTCNEDGLKVIVCKYCGEEMGEEVIPAIGSKFETNVVVYPTHAAAGYYIKTCTNAGLFADYGTKYTVDPSVNATTGVISLGTKANWVATGDTTDSYTNIVCDCDVTEGYGSWTAADVLAETGKTVASTATYFKMDKLAETAHDYVRACTCSGAGTCYACLNGRLAIDDANAYVACSDEAFGSSNSAVIKFVCSDLACTAATTKTITKVAHKYYEAPNRFNEFELKTITYDATTGNCTSALVWTSKCVYCATATTTILDESGYYNKGHQKVVVEEEIPATCKDLGYEAVWYCANCTIYGTESAPLGGMASGVRKTIARNHDYTANQLQALVRSAVSELDVRYLIDTNTIFSAPSAANATTAIQNWVAYLAADKDKDVADRTYLDKVVIDEFLTFTFAVPGTCTTAPVFGGFSCTKCDTSSYTTVGSVPFVQTAVDTYGDPVDNTHSLVLFDPATSAVTLCAIDKYSVYNCTVCEALFLLDYEKGDHKLDTNADKKLTPADTSYVAKDYLAPTCVLDGSMSFKCQEPNCNFVQVVTIEANGHWTDTGTTGMASQEIKDSCLDRTVDRYCGVCKQTIPMSHNFGEWVANGDVETSTCYNCGVVETKNVAPETEAPVTDAPVTDAPVVDEPATDAPETDAPVVDEPAKKGCKSSIAAIGVALVATLGTCAVFCGKKKED